MMRLKRELDRLTEEPLPLPPPPYPPPSAPKSGGMPPLLPPCLRGMATFHRHLCASARGAPPPHPSRTLHSPTPSTPCGRVPARPSASARRHASALGCEACAPPSPCRPYFCPWGRRRRVARRPFFHPSSPRARPLQPFPHRTHSCTCPWPRLPSPVTRLALCSVPSHPSGPPEPPPCHRCTPGRRTPGSAVQPGGGRAERPGGRAGRGTARGG